MSAKPVVALIVAGDYHELKIKEQDYPVILKYDKDVTNVPEFFNTNLNIEADIFCCLSPFNNFTSNNVINKAVHKLLEHPSLGMVYSDGIIVDSGYESYMLYPAFHPNILFSDIMINSPLIFRKPFNPILFDPTLELLYFYDFFLKYGRKTMPVHIAEPMFSTINKVIDFDAEFAKLKACHNQ